MKCPKCGGDVRIVDIVRAADNELWRKKKCEDCKRIFYTIEFEVEENQQFKEEWEVYIRTRKHKKESDMDLQEYRKYTYDGPVKEFDRVIADHWHGSTYAVSAKKAKSNLTYQFKKEFNKIANTNISLVEKVKLGD